jgi:hypothetical protein
MSNKKTIKRRPEPAPKAKKEEEKKQWLGFGPAIRRMRLVSLIPAIVFIAISIWYFISATQ